MTENLPEQEDEKVDNSLSQNVQDFSVDTSQETPTEGVIQTPEIPTSDSPSSNGISTNEIRRSQIFIIGAPLSYGFTQEFSETNNLNSDGYNLYSIFGPPPPYEIVINGNTPENGGPLPPGSAYPFEPPPSYTTFQTDLPAPVEYLLTDCRSQLNQDDYYESDCKPDRCITYWRILVIVCAIITPICMMYIARMDENWY
ncbi:hypothetical protein HHI36_014547 [Cryptolaemus montrouzieri]|uniref:Uncharacterized protein n=1 Tax=Cryptolaemus montrouzieri TaxID=559131 RepID=A0ABD2N3F2_9CUCU